MSTLLVRWVFATLCGVFFFSIGGVAVWEVIRFRRGESALSPRHFRWRMLSAATWLIVLASFFVATAFLWPQTRADTLLARRFLLVSSSALLLMMLAFVFMAVDVFWTVQVGRRGVQERALRRQQALHRQGPIGVPQRESGGSLPISDQEQSASDQSPNADRNGHYPN